MNTMEVELETCPVADASAPAVPTSTRPAVKPTTAWRLEWNKRAGGLGDHWIGRLGILVAPIGGEAQPLHLFLRDAVEQLAAQLSAPSQQWRDAGAVQRSVTSILQATKQVVDQPAVMPDHLPAICAHAMLWGNFLDVGIALVDLALTGRGGLLSVDAHTLAIITPRPYSKRRAAIAEAEAAADFYAVEGPDRADRAWEIQAEDGGLAPSVLWGLMNAFNCQFSGPASLGKDKMRSWCLRTTKRFLGALERESITPEEFSAFASSW